jgi:acyl-CoA reductase-like NAD-dependent aldehyde dehydrogenase
LNENRAANGSGSTPFDPALAGADEALSRVRNQRSNADITAVLVKAARAWCAPDYPPRKRVTKALAESNRVDPGMISVGLDAIFGIITTAEITELLRREAGDAGTLEPRTLGAPEHCDSGRRFGPRLLYCATAGNLPGQSVPVLVSAALARSAVVIRDSARQPGLTAAFVESIRMNDPDLGDTFVVIDGRRGEDNDTAVRHADRIEISGHDQTLEKLSAHYRDISPAEIILHGARSSAAVIAAGADLTTAAQGVALDAVMYEGRGCLTPHTVFVERDALSFAEQLADALSTFQSRWPRKTQSLAEETARRSFVDNAELSALSGTESAILRGPADVWCVGLGPATDVRPGPGHRCVRVVATANRRATLKRLGSMETPPAGIAIAGEAVSAAGKDFCEIGATRVCKTGELQRPPLYWEQDGRRRLAELLSTGGANPDYS